MLEIIEIALRLGTVIATAVLIFGIVLEAIVGNLNEHRKLAANNVFVGGIVLAGIVFMIALVA